MIIHIEPEGTPKNTIEKTAPISTVTPGSLNFMDTDEQQRVRKLLDSLKSSEAKDMDTQTEDTSELGKYFEKCVQTECLNPGNCSGMMSYLQQINKKIDMLISRQGNLKLLQPHQALLPTFQFPTVILILAKIEKPCRHWHCLQLVLTFQLKPKESMTTTP